MVVERVAACNDSLPAAMLSATIATMRRTSSAVILHVNEIRMRDVPAGTVGGRIALAA
jgi:hypothetical protein